MEVFLMRKLASLTLALIVAGGVMIAMPAPASAAAKISNGVACKKLNQMTPVSGSKYKCAKNPLSTSKKLTWLSLDCLNSGAAYVKAKADAATIPVKVAEQLKVIDVGITTETANKALMQVKLDKANTGLAAAKVKLAAATSDADKKVYTKIVADWTAASRGYTSNLNQMTLALKKLESAKLTIASQPEQLKADLDNTKANAQLICTKGF
jgi:hypothetical protein